MGHLLYSGLYLWLVQLATLEWQCEIISYRNQKKSHGWLILVYVILVYVFSVFM